MEGNGKINGTAPLAESSQSPTEMLEDINEVCCASVAGIVTQLQPHDPNLVEVIEYTLHPQPRGTVGFIVLLVGANGQGLALGSNMEPESVRQTLRVALQQVREPSGIVVPK